RLLALVEPDSASPATSVEKGGVSPWSLSPGSAAGVPSPGDDPGLHPVDLNDNQHHPPPPPTTQTSNDPSRTWCDPACDSIWNDIFPSCSCNGSPGSTNTSNSGCNCNNGPGSGSSSSNSGCDCTKGTGSSSSSGSSGCLKCAHVNRGAPDVTGTGISAL